MADELINPLVDETPTGDSLKVGTVPADLAARPNLQRQIFPKSFDAGVVVETVASPEGSTKAALVSGAETYDLSALEDLTLIVDDYEGRKNAPGSVGFLMSGSFPAVAVTSLTDDQIKVGLHGEVTQQITLGTLSGGAVIAAAIQAAVRALTAASPENQAAYDGFLCEYVAPVFSALTTVQLEAVKQGLITLSTVVGLQVGDVLRIADQAGGPEAAFNVTVLDVDYHNSQVLVTAFEPGEVIEVGAIVQSAGDYYKLSSGKKGADSAVLVEAGTNDGSAALKLTSATGAITSAGRDVVGKQVFSFVSGDFASPVAATAEEVVAVLNRTLTGAIASGTTEVTVTSRKFGASTNVRALAGTSQAALGFATTIEVGTQTDIPLRESGMELHEVQHVDSGTPGVYISPTGFRIEGDRLVNVDGTDYSATSSNLRLTYSPRLRG